MRRTSGAVLAGCALLLLAGCASASATATPDGAPSSTATSAAGANAEDRGADWCADPAVAARVDEALASTTETQHNAMLVSPEEMTELGESEAAIAAQVAAWEDLSAHDLAYQQCLRIRQGQPTADPVPGGDR